MSDEAQMSMMLYAGFTPEEESKLQSIEAGVVSYVMGKHGNVRPMWQSSQESSGRQIQLTVPSAQPQVVVWHVSANQFSQMSAQDVLAALRGQ